MSTTGSTNRTSDVFAAAKWFDSLSNSSARAIATDQIEWQCNTWGSSRANGGWECVGLFWLVAAVFALPSFRNYEGREELVVCVPLEQAHDVIDLIERIGEQPEEWPWFGCDENDDALAAQAQIDMAAKLLGWPIDKVACNDDLLKALRITW